MNSYPKILFINHTAQMGGAEYSLLDIAKNFKECEVLLLSTGLFAQLLHKHKIKTRIIPVSDQMIKISQKNKSWLSFAIVLPELIKTILKITRLEKSYDLIYANSQKSFLISCIAAYIVRKPIIWHLRDILTREHFSRQNIYLVTRFANLFATIIIANSQATAQAYISSGGRKDLITVVHNGIDPSQFQQINSDEIKKLRAKFTKPDEKLIGSFGRITRWKGHHILIQALVDLPENVHVLIMGGHLFSNSDYLNYLKRLTRSLKLAKRVHLRDFHQNIAPYLQICDIITSTSVAPEPFGRVIVEAMISHKPVIASYTGGAPEIIKNNRDGLLIQPGDPKLLAESILKILDNNVFAQKISLNGYNRAKKDFTVNQMIPKIKTIVNQVVKNYEKN